MKTTYELLVTFELDTDELGWKRRDDLDAPAPRDEVRAHELASLAVAQLEGVSRYAVNPIK